MPIDNENHNDDLEPIAFAINACVKFNAGEKDIEGLVVAVVKPGELPSFRRFPQLFKSVCEEGPRQRESFVVVANGQAHWPESDQLRLKNSVANAVARVKIAHQALPVRPQPARCKAGAIVHAQPTRLEKSPGSSETTKLLFAPESSIVKAAFYPFLPHVTEPYGPIFKGHFDGEKVVAHVCEGGKGWPVHLKFFRAVDDKRIAFGFLAVKPNGSVSLMVHFRDGRKMALTATHAGAGMLLLALGIAHVPKGMSFMQKPAKPGEKATRPANASVNSPEEIFA